MINGATSAENNILRRAEKLKVSQSVAERSGMIFTAIE